MNQHLIASVFTSRRGPGRGLSSVRLWIGDALWPAWLGVQHLGGVDIEVDGPGDTLDRFVAALTAEAPSLARIDAVEVSEIDGNGFTSFEIRHSESNPTTFCPSRRHHVVCGLQTRTARSQRSTLSLSVHQLHQLRPRFTIIKDIPYDRPFTTMADFVMCEDCAREYADPLNRRFHAQPWRVEVWAGSMASRQGNK